MLSAEQARQLDLVTLGANRAAPAASASGARVAKARGFGSEFHDFRHYQPGDDLRSIEWTVYARLRQLVTRTYRADAHLRVHLLLDTSASMRVGTPDKLSCARTLASVLCYVAIREGDAVGVATFDERIAHRVAPASGRPQLFRVMAALDGTASEGVSAIGRSLMDYGAVERGPGLVVIISDFFDPAGTFEGLRYLLHRGLTPAVVQVLASEELDPSAATDTELVDVEDPSAAPLLIDRDAIAAYRSRLDEMRAALGEFCLTHGLPWIEIGSADSFNQLLHACRRAGLLAGQN